MTALEALQSTLHAYLTGLHTAFWTVTRTAEKLSSNAVARHRKLFSKLRLCCTNSNALDAKHAPAHQGYITDSVKVNTTTTVNISPDNVQHGHCSSLR
jgi:hypothetical protein